MNKLWILKIICFLSMWNTAFAQQDTLRIEDCFNPINSPKRLGGLQWIPNSNFVSYVKNKSWITQNIFSLTIDSSFNINDINKGFTEGELKLTFTPFITWLNENEFRFEHEKAIYTYNKVEKATKLNLTIGDYEIKEVHEKSQNHVTIFNNNLFIVTPTNKLQITTDGGNGILYGQAVHRNEFGINKGIFWNNSGTKFAFYRMDEKRVSNIPEIKINTIPANTSSFKYPMAGDSSHSVEVGIYNLETNTITYLKINEDYDAYKTNIAWDLADEFVYVAIINRDQNKMKLNTYSPITGELETTLFTETNERYVEPENPPVFLPNGDGFLWLSEKDGFNHIYWYNKKGKECQITKGTWEVTEIYGFDEENKGVYFQATEASPLERHLYYLAFKDKEKTPKRITNGTGTHFTYLNNTKSMYIDELTSTSIPRNYVVYKIDGTTINTLQTSPNPLSKYNLGKVEIRPIVKDNIAFYTRTYFPPNFDRSKKYPCIVYVYGGPHAQMITESWLAGGNLWFYYMAQRGYIVYTLDNRGSAHRGFNFESVVHKQLGNLEMEDQLYGLDQLKKLNYIDEKRIGVHGWSFGGFMTTSLMTRNAGIFKVGVAGGPVIDWKMYEIMYTERYMDRPTQNPDGYKNANLLNHLNKLNNRLLMIHGMDDDVVIWQHSLNYLNNAIKLGNDNLDYYFYPGHKHNVTGKDRIHLHKKISQYFFDHL